MSWLEQRQRSTVGWQKNRGKPGPGLRAEDERGTGWEHVGHRRHRRLARRIQARQLVRAEEERGWTPQPPAVRSTDPRFIQRGGGSHEARSRRDQVLICLLATLHTGPTPVPRQPRRPLLAQAGADSGWGGCLWLEH